MISRIKCFFGYHKLFQVEKIGLYSEKLYCSRCKNYFGIHHQVEVFLPWCEEFEEFRKIMNRDDK
jgi:hypothetical protein